METLNLACIPVLSRHLLVCFSTPRVPVPACACTRPAAPRPKKTVCLETLATMIDDMGKDDLRVLETLVVARQRELR